MELFKYYLIGSILVGILQLIEGIRFLKTDGRVDKVNVFFAFVGIIWFGFSLYMVYYCNQNNISILIPGIYSGYYGLLLLITQTIHKDLLAPRDEMGKKLTQKEVDDIVENEGLDSFLKNNSKSLPSQYIRITIFFSICFVAACVMTALPLFK